MKLRLPTVAHQWWWTEVEHGLTHVFLHGGQIQVWIAYTGTRDEQLAFKFDNRAFYAGHHE